MTEDSMIELPPESGEMSLIDHLKELRNRAIIAMAALVIGVIVSFIFWRDIAEILIGPAKDHDPNFQLATFAATEAFFLSMKLSLYSGLVVASPVIIYEILMFVLPGLTAKEKKLILPSMFGVLFFLLLGIAFAYYVILPASLGFLLDFGGEDFQEIIQAGPYFSFTMRLILLVGISFEMPMVIALLARLGVVTARKVLGFWRYMVVIIFIIAAVVTPTPDPITQTFVAGPLVVLYLVGIGLAYLVQPKKDKELSA